MFRVVVLLGVLLAGVSCQWSPAEHETDSARVNPARVPTALQTQAPAPAEGRSQPVVSGKFAAWPAATFDSPFAAVAEKVQPSVVNVNTRKTFEHPPVRRRDNSAPFNPFDDSDAFEYPSSASGFVFDSRGYVLTNHHVVENADDIRVQFMDGTEYQVEVIGVDPSTDIAVLRILEAGSFPVAELGDSDSMRVGDWAIAVGNPFGYLGGSVTVGIISALGRDDLDIMGGTPAYQNFIQTDASINFGNSGGPLFNIRGQVIGINTAVNPSGQGLGFAIPMNLAMRMARSLIEHGRVVRGYLGILPQELSADLALAKGMDGGEGILVGQVIADTPAERAGIERGDIIRSFNGVPVARVNEFRMAVADAGVGNPCAVRIWRGGKTIEKQVVLTERPDAVVAERPGRPRGEWLGLHVTDIADEPEIARNLGVEGETGVLVLDVDSGSSAGRAGIEEGDVILEMNDAQIQNKRDYDRARGLISDSEKPIILLVRHQGFTRYVAIRP